MDWVRVKESGRLIDRRGDQLVAVGGYGKPQPETSLEIPQPVGRETLKISSKIPSPKIEKFVATPVDYLAPRKFNFDALDIVLGTTAISLAAIGISVNVTWALALAEHYPPK
jgi:hypothetical protein